MANNKRPWGVVAGPVIFVVGLAGFWGAKSAVGLKDRVSDWGHQIEHSREPVVMEMPNLPLIPPLYVNNERVGRIRTVVVERDRVGAIDSVSIIASLGDEYHAALEDCANIRLRISSLDGGGYRRALRCTADVGDLVPFGHLEVEGTNLNVPLVVRVGDLPCDRGRIAVGPCGEISDGLRRELRGVERELRRARAELRVQVQGLKEEVRATARAAIR